MRSRPSSWNFGSIKAISHNTQNSEKTYHEFACHLFAYTNTRYIFSTFVFRVLRLV